MSLQSRPLTDNALPTGGAGIRVSVVTPSLNKAAWLREAVESVLSQEGDFEMEYFVVDGGSVDGSVDILRTISEEMEAGKWSGRCRRATFTWNSSPDGGQAAAINKGLRNATGDIACYLNADDALAPGAIQSVCEAFLRNPAADFIYGDGDVIDEHGNVMWEWLSRPYSHAVMTGYHYLWNDFTNYIMQQAVFWRTRVHDAIGLFDEDFHYAMDVEYWVRAGSRGLRLIHIPRKLARFRFIAGTKSLSGPTVFWADYLEIFRRYRPGRPLTWPLAFYYFNAARSRDHDLATAAAADAVVTSRWRSLPEAELQSHFSEREKALAIAAVLAALDLQRMGEAQRAEAMVSRARASVGLCAAVRAGICLYRVRAVIGRAGRLWIDRICDGFINVYRSKRYHYRYESQRR